MAQGLKEGDVMTCRGGFGDLRRSKFSTRGRILAPAPMPCWQCRNSKLILFGGGDAVVYLVLGWASSAPRHYPPPCHISISQLGASSTISACCHNTNRVHVIAAHHSIIPMFRSFSHSSIVFPSSITNFPPQQRIPGAHKRR